MIRELSDQRIFGLRQAAIFGMPGSMPLAGEIIDEAPRDSRAMAGTRISRQRYHSSSPYRDLSAEPSASLISIRNLAPGDLPRIDIEINRVKPNMFAPRLQKYGESEAVNLQIGFFAATIYSHLMEVREIANCGGGTAEPALGVSAGIRVRLEK